jgi:hypothetical protein
MRPWLYELWKDERGSLLVTEWMFVATILMLVMLATALSVRNRMCQTSMQLATCEQANPISSYEPSQAN